MKRIFFKYLCVVFCIIFISCSNKNNFTDNELAEFYVLAKKLEQKDFTFGKKMENSKTLKLYKVRENFSREEDFFSLEEFSLIENKIKFVQKKKRAVCF
ncbi:hypothetical protein [Treponema zioleckii]|uniref:hypothetical protein n=1 Tax=Treponema zioleckii TaxID=331680 RepID=UPI00168B9A6D|nr:hypothetical protein [Treponema zioleckii]